VSENDAESCQRHNCVPLVGNHDMLAYQDTIDGMILKVSVFQSLDRTILAKHVGAVIGKFWTAAFIVENMFQLRPCQVC
jgi:hypothetical protein